MFDLSGKKALVTGASGGLGEAIARASCTRKVLLSGCTARGWKSWRRWSPNLANVPTPFPPI